MDRRAELRAAKRGREEEKKVVQDGGGGDFPFEEAARADGGVVGEASRRPPGVFQLPWQKCSGGLGVPAGAGAGWELRDVFFRSLVDGGAAAIGVPGDRLVSPPPTRLEGVDAWLAADDVADGVDPVWRSARKGGPAPAPSSVRPAVVG